MQVNASKCVQVQNLKYYFIPEDRTKAPLTLEHEVLDPKKGANKFNTLTRIIPYLDKNK